MTVRTFTCAQCATTFTTTQTHVRQWPIEKWWRMVASQCADCRMQNTGEPAQGQYHANAHATEVQAALAVKPITGDQRMKVLSLLTWNPEGLTDDEGGALMGGDRLTFGRRRSELYRQGLVVDSGFKRKTPYGRNAIVWKLAEQAGGRP